MTVLSNIFSWFWLLFPGGPHTDSGPLQVQACDAPTEQVCPPAQEETQRKESPFRHFWKNANPNGISNGI
jgi:hypothetical protein